MAGPPPHRSVLRQTVRMRTGRFGRDERALTESIGTTLLVGVMVVVTTALGGLIIAQSPDDPLGATLALHLEAGLAGWGTGDERVVLTHKGGDPISLDQVAFVLTISGVREHLSGDDLRDLNDVFRDGVFTIGERWTVERTLYGGEEIRVEVVRGHDALVPSLSGNGGHRQDTLFTGLVAPGGSCALDTTPPLLTGWVREPATVRTDTVGGVTVRVTFVDGCAGLQPDSRPTLSYRLHGGTVPAWTTLGAMGEVTPGTFQATIPVPPGGWVANAGALLQYQTWSGPQDTRGNLAGPSAIEETVVTDPHAPTAAFTWSCTDRSCSFSAASSSAAPGRTLAAYAWVLGDGTTASGATTSRTYATSGTYTVTLTVTDGAGSMGTVSREVDARDRMHVHLLDAVRRTGSSTEVTVEVRTGAEAVLAGATVTAAVCKAGGTCRTLTGTTGAGGIVKMNFGPPGGGSGTYTMCVSSITHSTHVYDRSADHVTGQTTGSNGQTCRTKVV